MRGGHDHHLEADEEVLQAGGQRLCRIVVVERADYAKLDQARDHDTLQTAAGGAGRHSAEGSKQVRERIDCMCEDSPARRRRI